MEDIQKLQDDFERVIEKDNTSSTVTTNTNCEETVKHGPLSIHQRLDAIIHSNRFQAGIIVLVVIDIFLVLGVLLFDLEIVQLQTEHEEIVSEVLHYCSIFILSLFIVEISVRIFVMRLTFFKHKLEIFDALVVIVSFVLDVVFVKRQDAASGAGLLILLRLWRVARIFNGIVLSVKRQAEKKIKKERHLREACEQELSKFRSYCTLLETEIESLHRLLKQNGIQYSEKVEKRPASTQISVEVEVNHLASKGHSDGGVGGSGGGSSGCFRGKRAEGGNHESTENTEAIPP